MSADPVGKSPSIAPPVPTDDIDDAWASAESPESSERSKPELETELQGPASEQRSVSERPRVTSRPPAVRVSSKSFVDPGTGSARGNTLLGIPPIPEISSDLLRTPPSPLASSPAESTDDGASKFEAAARVLEQKRASEAPKPPARAATATSPAEQDAPASPPTGAAERGKRKRVRKSTPAPRSRGLPFVLGTAVFAVMFVAGALRALREGPSAPGPNRPSPASIVAAAPEPSPPPSSESLPAAPLPVVTAEPPAGETEAPAEPAEPVASAEPARKDTSVRVLVRAAVAGAKFYRNGKQVGMNSVVVELGPGETRAFEVDLPGYVARKVIVDGSRSEVVVILPRLREHAGSVASPTGEAASAPSDMNSTP